MMSMKYIITTFCGVMLSLGLSAQDSIRSFPEYSFGLHTGMDIGAAVPFPPASAGGMSKMRATPNLNPALGASANMRIDDRWSVALEVTYKQVGIDATARVNKQKYRDPNNEDLSLYFKGTAEIDMEFSMLEIPVYAGYRFGKNDNKAILGLYYSRVFKSKFTAHPLKGVLTPLDNPDEWTEVGPEKSMDPQDFDESMSKWDFGFLVGYEWKVHDKVYVGARYSMGLKDIFKRNEKFLDYKMLHMRGTVVISYRFFTIK